MSYELARNGNCSWRNFGCEIPSRDRILLRALPCSNGQAALEAATAEMDQTVVHDKSERL